MATTSEPFRTLRQSATLAALVQHPDAKLYSASIATGATTGLAAGDTLMSFRTGSGITVVTMVRHLISQVTAFAAAKFLTADLYAARSFTVSDSGAGSTTATLTGNNAKQRTSDATSGVADFRAANTAGLTVGTRTLDAQPFARTSFVASTTALSSLSNGGSLINVGADAGSAIPLVLAANEGFVVQAGIAYPATGTLNYFFTVQWFEIAAW
jgi:hypothetical protein